MFCPSGVFEDLEVARNTENAFRHLLLYSIFVLFGVCSFFFSWSLALASNKRKTKKKNKIFLADAHPQTDTDAHKQTNRQLRAVRVVVRSTVLLVSSDVGSAGRGLRVSRARVI